MDGATWYLHFCDIRFSVHNKLKTLVKGFMEEYHNKIKEFEDKIKKRKKNKAGNNYSLFVIFIYSIIEVYKKFN